MKNKYWRIWNFINPTLRVWKGAYLEIGGDGKVARMIKGDVEIVTPEKVPTEWSLYEFDLGIEDFFSLIAPDRKLGYRVILLRDWDEENLEQRIKACFEMLSYDGVLILEGYDRTGERNETWRIAGGLKKHGISTGVEREKYLTIFKTGEFEEIQGSITLKIKKRTFQKNPQKYLL
jgi:hypothetical protein